MYFRNSCICAPVPPHTTPTATRASPTSSPTTTTFFPMFRTLRRPVFVRFTSSSTFAYVTSAADLARGIKDHILSGPNVSADTVLAALKACRQLQAEGREPSKTVQRHVESILACEHVPFDASLLKRALLLRFSPSTAVRVLQLYQRRNPKAAVELETALIPFRGALFDADLQNALRITDLTTGHPNYIARKQQTLRRGVYQFAATAIGITLFSKVGVQQVIDMGWLSPVWKHLSAVNAMLLTYLANSSFFVTIVRFGRQLSTAGGDFLTWQKGTFYTHWYRHADEMSMCARIMETDLRLNGGLENSPDLVAELCRKDDNVSAHHTLRPGLTRDGHKVRLLEPRDNLEQLKMQAYWMSGGDGFEWVEPDQDPAEIVWRNHLASLQKPVLQASDTRSLKWAEDLITSRDTKDI
ncbi:hypothetical protein CLUG_05385 [Clavispora lusitaniae ATCC 42720]|uniref:Uncharacterized protein n=2 Tax=Clavispora lusitaniae TaxID=36911 RepID=C4YB93_CLAL4|nr:uncharacterized protein CLUG_05385 [Clavispora lusitaniae ATCC 42720]EEQ41257.1 hypothetical protein CLUG_05385 [Clavispora lusitaniae ATCC 42720]